jgi:hypothetical protein
MQKNPENKEYPLVVKDRKNKRNKKPTTKEVLKRKPFHCGICGSDKIIFQGVRYCNRCGMEVPFIDSEKIYFFRREKRICDCEWVYTGSKGIDKCLECGSVSTRSACPNCERECWVSPFGSKHCKWCGYIYEAKRKTGD